MLPENGPDERLEFEVGSEIRLKDIIFRTDLNPLFAACLTAGATGVALKDTSGTVLKAKGITDATEGLTADSCQQRPLSYEGEQVGTLSCIFTDKHCGMSGIADMAAACMQLLIYNTAKRLLATALHTSVVNLSYAELLESNTKLQASEEKYRKLAESLEQKVEERTAELKMAHARLLQQEKMASIGQLAAGMAHEINNPLGFIASNLNTFESYTQKLVEMLRFSISQAKASGTDDSKMDEIYRKLKIGFILEDLPELIKQSRDGAGRVKDIVANLKGFSHIDDAHEDYIDINQELDRTIDLLQHDCNGRVTFIKHYGSLPKYLCRPAHICQVFMNIIQNAVQATDLPLQIMLTTSEADGMISIRIEDDGPGIPEEIKGRIFEPFFTTKDVGKGTGLGLSIAYDIIREHGGEISVESRVGEGAIFKILLPLKGVGNV